MSAGNFGSAIGVTAQISLRRDQIAADAQAARAELTAAFQSMEIPLGAKLIESATAAAPTITTIIAEAIAAGTARGLGGIGSAAASGGAFSGGFAGGGSAGGYDFEADNFMPAMGFAGLGGTANYSQSGPGIPPVGATAGEMIADNAQFWAAQQMTQESLDRRFERSEDLAEAGLRPKFGSSDPYESEEAGGSVIGGGGLLIGGYLGFRAAKGLASYADKEADLSAQEFETSGMPSRTLNQQLRKAEKEQQEAQSEIDENSGPTGMLRRAFSLEGAGSGDFFSYNHMFGTAFDDRLNQNQGNADTNVREIKSQQDLKEREQDSRKEELETKIYEARKRGNEADADHLELLNKIEQKQNVLNAKGDGSGDRFRNGLGAEMLDDQSTRATAASAMQEVQNQQSLVDIQGSSHEMSERANGAHTQADRDRFSRQLDARLTAAAVARDKVLNDPNSSEQQKKDAQSTFDAVSAATISDQSSYDQSIAKEQKQQVDDVNEHTKELNMGGGYAAERSHISYEYNKQIKAAREDGNHDLVDALEKEKDSALRHMGGGPTFTSGIETWKKMQRAGYGSDRGTDSGAQRTYASHGGGGGAAGGMISGGNPLIGSSSPMIHGGLPSANYGSPIQAGGSSATHGLGYSSILHDIGVLGKQQGLGTGGNHPHNGEPAAHDDVSKSLMEAAKNLNAATQKKMVIVSGVAS